MLKIEVNNIGGLNGVHKFSFDTGLSILHAPNASGKSSLLKAIHLLIGNKRLEPELLSTYLSEKEVNGYVKAEVDGESYEVQIQRKKDSVEVTYSNVDNELYVFPAEELSYVNGNSDFYQGVLTNDMGQITSWFQRVTQVHKFQLFLEISTKILSDFKSERDELKRKISKDASAVQAQIEEKEAERERIKKKKQEIEDSEEYQKLASQMTKNREHANSLQKEVSKIDQAGKDLHKIILDFEEELRGLEKDLVKKQKSIEVFDANSKLKQAEYRIKEARNDELEAERQALETALTQVKQDLTKERDLFNDYKKLVKRETCPTCHQKLDNKLIVNFVDEKGKTVKSLEQDSKRISKEIKDIKIEQSDIESDLKELRDFLKLNRDKAIKEITVMEELIRQKNNELKDKQKKRANKLEELQQSKEKLLKIQEALAKENPLEEKKFELMKEENDLDIIIRKLLDELQESNEYQSEYEEIDAKIVKAEAVHEHYSRIVRHLTSETIDRINAALLDSFELLELAKLKKIEYGEKDGLYTLEIQRANNVYTTLEKMSGAEKALITLIVTWVTKQEVMPDEPLFLVDEVITEMDDTRFKDILQYISKKTDFVMVARHRPFTGKKEILSQNHIVTSYT
ncbi:MAG: AAA family ATPase [Candidatus Helarchaeota archaeon]